LKSGPGTHIVDTCGLSDPLLARIPPKHITPWRPGHFERQTPTDYLISVRAHENQLADPALRPLYNAIREVTREPLWSWRRWQHIVMLNRSTAWLTQTDFDRYRFETIPKSARVPIRFADEISTTGHCAVWDSASHLFFEDSAEIRLRNPTRVKALRLVLDNSDEYQFEYFSNDAWHQLLAANPKPVQGFDLCSMIASEYLLPHATPLIDRIRVRARSDGMYAIGKFEVVGDP
jgi:hypothetical protein